MYLFLFIITAPLPLSAFKIAVSLLSDSSLTTFLYLYGTFILVFLSHVFLRFVLLSNIIAELFNMCLKGSCFPDFWKVLSAFPVFKNVVERSTAKNYRLVSLLSVVLKNF